MLIRNNLLTVSLLAMFAFSTNAAADNAPSLLSFNQPDVYKAVSNNIETLSNWARSEYIEHESEELFRKYPNDGQIIGETLTLVNELKKLAQKANAEGKHAKAKAYLFSAETTANYAANMPHMLEARLEQEASTTKIAKSH